MDRVEAVSGALAKYTTTAERLGLEERHMPVLGRSVKAVAVHGAIMFAMTRSQQTTYYSWTN